MSKEHPQTITEEEEEQIVGQLRIPHHTERQKIRCYRNLAMFYLMLDAGLRVGEVVRLPRNALCIMNQVGSSVFVPATIAKNKTARTIPMTENVRVAIDHVQTYVWKPQNVQLLDFAFFKNDPTKHLTTRAIESFLVLAGLQATKRWIHPHMLRHTFATRLMKRTNIRVVQMLLGHRSITSTQVYTHPSWEDLQNAVNGSKNACG